MGFAPLGGVVLRGETDRRSGVEIPVKELLPLLDDGDRWVRYASRIAIEHAGPEKSRGAILAGETVRAQLRDGWQPPRPAGMTRDDLAALIMDRLAEPVPA